MTIVQLFAIFAVLVLLRLLYLRTRRGGAGPAMRLPRWMTRRYPRPRYRCEPQARGMATLPGVPPAELVEDDDPRGGAAYDFDD